MMAIAYTAPSPDLSTLKAHEAAQWFPVMGEDELRKLADDIAAHGQHDPIVLYPSGNTLVVLDGRNRILACRIAGIDPKWEERSDVDPVDFVFSRNLRRRQLTESQKEMVAAKLANFRHGGDRSKPPIGGLTQEQVAGRLGVSVRNLQRARVVLESGEADLVAAVDSGVMSVSAAAKLVTERAHERAAQANTYARDPDPAPPATAECEAAEPTEPSRSRRVNHEKRSGDVRRLHDEGKGTHEIARELGLVPSTVSAVKGNLGVSASSPAKRLWDDIDRAAVSLSGVLVQIDKLVAALEDGAPISAPQEEIESCIRALQRTATGTRRLFSLLRSRLPCR